MNEPRLFILLLSVLVISACQQDKPFDEDVNPKDYTVIGKIEKGPFIQGSELRLQPLDIELNPVGTVYTSEIKDNEGCFNILAKAMAYPYAQLIGSGYFYNEVTGELSKSTLRLEAIVDLSDKQTVNLNLLTHLKKDRIKNLMGTGKSFSDANQQAQHELLQNFGLQQIFYSDVSSYSIISGSNEAGAIIILSSAFLLNRTEAQLTEYISSLNQQFASTGRFNSETISKYRQDTQSLNIEKIGIQLINRYASLGKQISVVPLQYFVDWDNDGIAGNEATLEQAFAFDQDTLFVPPSGGTFKVSVKGYYPVSMPDGGDISAPNISVGANQFATVNTEKVQYSATLSGREFTIQVESATAYNMSDSDLYAEFQAQDTTYYAKLVIKQEGDKNLPEYFITSTGEYLLQDICQGVVSALSPYYLGTALYTNTYTTSLHNDPFELHTLNSDNPNIDNIWKSFYRVLSKVRQVEQSLYDETLAKAFLPSFNIMKAAMYYNMALVWGKIPVLTDVNDPFDRGQIMDMESLASYFVPLLRDAIASDEQTIYPRDFARMTLSRIFVEQKNYSEAKILLDEIVSSRRYQLANYREEAITLGSPDLIYGLDNSIISTPRSTRSSNYSTMFSDCIPLATYTEAVSLLAECEYYLNNKTKAMEYVNTIIQKRGLNSASDFINTLQAIWSSELKGTGTYFAFLKRNGLAKQILGIQDYQLLFPIPSQELNLNPDLSQNNGY